MFEAIIDPTAGPAAGSEPDPAASGGLVLGPEHAQLLGSAGYRRADVQQWLFSHAVRDRADMIAAGKGEHAGTESGGGPFAMMPSADAIPILVAGAANAAMSMVFRPFGWAAWSGRSVPVAWKGADDLGRGHFTPTAPNPDNPELLADRAKAWGPGGVLTHGRGGGLGGPTGDEPWRRPSRWAGPRAPMVPMGTTGTPTDIGHAVAWLCSDYARLITGTDLVVDGGARAKNFAYSPAAPEDLAGPLPLIVLDDTSA